jgi:GT2 family glycosyltransferase
VGIVAPRLVHPDGSLQPSCQRAPTAVRELIHLARLDALLPGLYYPMRRWPTDAPRSVDVVMGACLLVRRDVLEQAGRLHEGYFMYSEEVELCERVRAAGRRIDWLPQAVVMHHGGASAEPVADEMFLALYRSKALFHRRNRGPLALAAFRGVIVLAALPRLVAGLAAAVPLLGGARRAKLRRTARRYVRLLRALPEMG